MRVILALVSLVVLVGLFHSTNTSVDAQPIFATNTPPPPDPLDAVPEASQEQYALRLWQEADMVALLVSQMRRLGAGEDIPIESVRMTQYELDRRFPDALDDPDLRADLLQVMLTAPRGSVDMRSVVRPTIVDHLNAGDDDFGGFNVEVTTIDLNGDEFDDLYASVRYPATATAPSELFYDDHLLLVGNEDGTYTLPPLVDPIPAAPFDQLEAVMLWRVADLTQDGRTDMGILLDSGDINQELRVYGWRSGRIESLVAPDEPILVGSFLVFDQTTFTIDTTSFRLESERWQCRSTIDAIWHYEANFFRREFDPLADYEFTPSIGCAMLDAEPVFARTGDRAVEIVESILDGNDNPNDPGYGRANIALAMLYLLNGQPDAADERIERVLPFVEEDAWLAGQVETFVNQTVGDDVEPVQVCAALLRDNPNGACDMDQVLTQLFIENPLSRAGDVVEQLEDDLGLPVLDVLTLSEPGRLDRTAVNFNLTGASWWAFAPRDEQFYVPEIIDPPVEFGDTVFPAALIEVPEHAYDVLLNDNDPARALTILENTQQQAPGVPLSVSARYFQAFINDQLGDRNRARVAYFELWQDVPGTHYGQLAGAHLERR